MNINEILGLNSSAPPTAPTTSKTAAEAALDEALAASVAAPQVKTASAPSTPVADLEKLADDVAERRKQESLKLANLQGRAMCDGFVAQLGVYEKLAGEIAQGNAAKHAEFQQGRQAEAQQKQAAEAQQALEALHATGAAHWKVGYETTRALLG